MQGLKKHHKDLVCHAVELISNHFRYKLEAL